ncbi:MAG: LacI family DNA-binding transcriptional regulator [Bacteroidota bacterium]
MRVTIKEVAEKAGVSIATVSRVFNNRSVVQDETRKAVEEAARLLKYSPNSSARSLSTKRTDVIGMLLPDLHGEFFSEVIRASDLIARRNGFHLLVSSSHNDRSEIEAVLRAMHGRVDGLIIMSPLIDAETLKANLPSTLPLVLLNCYIHENHFDALNVDNVQGSLAMVRHLAEHGHRRIAMIKGTEGNIDAAERLLGYRTALSESGIGHSPSLEFDGDFDEESGYRATAELLNLKTRPTAIFAANDSMAIGALSALRSHGLTVPDEIALAGFDDIPIAQFMSPSLSTVRVHINELGLQAVERLIQNIKEKGRHHPRQTMLKVTPVYRESCGCGVSGRVDFSDLKIEEPRTAVPLSS